MSEDLMSLEEIEELKEYLRIRGYHDTSRVMRVADIARAAHRLQEEVEKLKVDLLCAKELNKRYEQLVKDCNGLSERLKVENAAFQEEVEQREDEIGELKNMILTQSTLMTSRAAENEELRKELTSANSRLHELAVYIVEIEGLRKDAERYRYAVENQIKALDIIGDCRSKRDADYDFDAAIKNGATVMDKYCLGYTHHKCGTCRLQDNWDVLNQMPDTLRIRSQQDMTRVNDEKCRLTNMGEWQERIKEGGDGE